MAGGDIEVFTCTTPTPTPMRNKPSSSKRTKVKFESNMADKLKICM